MKVYFKLELKKNIFSLRTVISVLIILMTFIIPYLEEFKFQYPGLDGVDYFMRIHQFSYIAFVAPVVAGFTYSMSIIKDKEAGFINKLLEIIDIKRLNASPYYTQIKSDYASHIATNFYLNLISIVKLFSTYLWSIYSIIILYSSFCFSEVNRGLLIKHTSL